jgi:rhodanese-related sulfurtransferase
VSPEDLKARLDTGENPLIVDLRTTLDVKAAPYAIPGAIRLAAEGLEHGTRELPRDRDVILYCSWPNEATRAGGASARAKRHHAHPAIGRRAWGLAGAIGVQAEAVESGTARGGRLGAGGRAKAPERLPGARAEGHAALQRGGDRLREERRLCRERVAALVILSQPAAVRQEAPDAAV